MGKFKISRFDLRIGKFSFDISYNKSMKRLQFSIGKRYFFTPLGNGPWEKPEDVKRKFFELKLK